jgi:predicted esterase
MARSMLIYREPVVPGACPGTLVGLHGRGGDVNQLEPLFRMVEPAFQVFAPQAARPISPATMGDHHEDTGFIWYFGGPELGRPEPATFGESLWQMEQFIYDIRDRQDDGRPLFLVGYDQGGVLAATMAGVVPELLSGVAVIRGYLPEVRGWSPPVEDAGGLPVLVVHDPEDPDVPIALIERTAEQLGHRQSTVELRSLPGSRLDLEAPCRLVADWLHARVLVS